MRADALFLGREAKGDCEIKRIESGHKPVEPVLRIGTEPVRPAQSCAQFSGAEIFKRSDGVVQAVVVKMEPLADAELRRVVAKDLVRRFFFAVLTQQSHVKVAVIVIILEE